MSEYLNNEEFKQNQTKHKLLNVETRILVIVAQENNFSGMMG